MNVETMNYQTNKQITSFTVMDVGGRSKMRALWRTLYQNRDALIFVVDSADRDRIEDAKAELDQLMTEDALRDKPVLVFFNKQDLPDAMTPEELTEQLGLHGLRDRKWFVQGTC